MTDLAFCYGRKKATLKCDGCSDCFFVKSGDSLGLYLYNWKFCAVCGSADCLSLLDKDSPDYEPCRQGNGKLDDWLCVYCGRQFSLRLTFLSEQAYCGFCGGGATKLPQPLNFSTIT